MREIKRIKYRVNDKEAKQGAKADKRKKNMRKQFSSIKMQQG